MDGVKEYIFPVYDVDADEFKEYIGFIRTKPMLIRCKDCFWYRSVELKADGTHDKRFKPSRCALWDEDMNDTDFCSYAMEKNDEKEEDKGSN